MEWGCIWVIKVAQIQKSGHEAALKKYVAESPELLDEIKDLSADDQKDQIQWAFEDEAAAGLSLERAGGAEDELQASEGVVRFAEVAGHGQEVNSGCETIDGGGEPGAGALLLSGDDGEVTEEVLRPEREQGADAAGLLSAQVDA